MSFAILSGRYWNIKELDKEFPQVDCVGEELQTEVKQALKIKTSSAQLLGKDIDYFIYIFHFF